MGRAAPGVCKVTLTPLKSHIYLHSPDFFLITKVGEFQQPLLCPYRPCFLRPFHADCLWGLRAGGIALCTFLSPSVWLHGGDCLWSRGMLSIQPETRTRRLWFALLGLGRVQIMLGGCGSHCRSEMACGGRHCSGFKTKVPTDLASWDLRQAERHYFQYPCFPLHDLGSRQVGSCRFLPG